MTQNRDFVENVKSNLQIEDVIGKTIQLHEESSDTLAGALSPSSKSGSSLKIDVKNQIFHDFASNMGGDVFNWIAYEHNLNIKTEFIEILKIAADLAGIPFEHQDEDRIKRAVEINEIRNTLTFAAEVYHANLTPEIREYIHKKWGINDSTIDTLKIGYASPDGKTLGSRGGLSYKGLIKAGLAYQPIGVITEFFKGRVVFPYWENGQVVYFAARGDKENLGTPDNEYENRAKYRKLLTHNEKHPDVSALVNNKYIWGKDTLKNHNFCVITEGIADAIILYQNGYPVLSPVTTQFAKHDYEQLIDLAKGLKTVYICNDNEPSKAGERGAIKTGNMLLMEKVDVRIIQLPAPEGEKVDVAEYFLSHNKEDFEKLKVESQDLLKFLLSGVNITDVKNDEKVKAVKKFVSGNIMQLPLNDGVLFIKTTLKDYSGLPTDIINEISKFYKAEKKGYDKQAAERKDEEANKKDTTADGKDEKEKDLECIKALIDEAKQANCKGFETCKLWIKKNALKIACVHRDVWAKEGKFVGGEIDYKLPDIFWSVAVAFDLKGKEIDLIYDEIHQLNHNYQSEKDKCLEIQQAWDCYSDAVREAAVNELKHGDPYRYIYDAWAEQHKGDEVIGKTLPVCAASAFVIENNDGLHFKPSGESGKGKTSGIDAFLNLLPPAMVVRGGISDKHVYYAGNEIRAGSIVFMDDRELSDNLKGVVKNSISNFQKPEPHRTVIDGKAISYTPAPRMVWMFASVDGFDDEQLANRFLMADVDESPEQDKRVADHQGLMETQRFFNKYSFKTDVCKCMYDILRLQNYDIVVPFQSEIADNWNQIKNRRNQPKFRDVIKAVCVYRVFQRSWVKSIVVADIEDYKRAYEIYAGTAKQNSTNLTALEERILDYLISKNSVNKDSKGKSVIIPHQASINDIAAALKEKVHTISRAIIGRKERGTPGLMGKVAFFFEEKAQERPYQNMYSYLGTHDFSQYENFIGNISIEAMKEQSDKFIQQLLSVDTEDITAENQIKNIAFQEFLSNNAILKDLFDSIAHFTQQNPSFTQILGIDKNNNSKDKKIEKNDDLPKNQREGESVKEKNICVCPSPQLSKFCEDTNIFFPETLGTHGNLGKSSVIKDSTEPNDNDSLNPKPLGKAGYSWVKLGDASDFDKKISGKKPRKTDETQEVLPTDEDYGEVEGIEVIDCSNDPDADEKFDRWIQELEAEGY